MRNYAIYPIASVDLSKLPEPKIDQFNSGGEHFGMLRNLIQCRAPGGEHITWGSDDRVTLTSRELEELVPRIAQHGAKMMLDQMLQDAREAEAHESWPGWMVDPGSMPTPRGWELYTQDGSYFGKMKCKDRSPEDSLETAWIDLAKYKLWLKAQLVYNQHLVKQMKLQRSNVQDARGLLVSLFGNCLSQENETVVDVEKIDFSPIAQLLDIDIPEALCAEMRETCNFLAKYSADNPGVDPQGGIEAKNAYADSYIGKLVDLVY